MSKRFISRTLQLCAYAICYLLLLEWLRPLQPLMNIDNLAVFVIFTAGMLILSYFRVKIIWKMIVAGLYILWAIKFLYFEKEKVFQLKWLVQFGQDFINSMKFIWELNFVDVPFTVQTTLLFFLLWIFTFLIYYWVMVKHRIFLYFFTCVLFIALLDTFSPYDGDAAIVRLLVMGCLLLGVITFKRIIEQDHLQIMPRHVLFWFTSLISTVLIISTISYFAPKLSSQWPNPIPFVKSFSEKFRDGASSVSKVGYGEEDVRLGGDFLHDPTVVFTVTTENKQYWKVETKDMYTGKGWILNENIETITPFEVGNDVPLQEDYTINQDSIVGTALVDVELPYSHVPYPNPVAQMAITLQNQNMSAETLFQYNDNSTKITSLTSDGSKKKLENYEVKYIKPTFKVDQLKESVHSNNVYLDRFTQLPLNLPDRIQGLAESLTKDKTNQYDKVQAIESYLKHGEFTYSNTDIPYPKKNQDFVEQFLFETKRGYCVHFATSMAVLLRSIDIPTRYVKGYTPGETLKVNDGKTTYQVTNNNAHAWVEVYFQGVGWVPFEPTKGFVNYASFQTSEVAPITATNPTQVQQDDKKDQTNLAKNKTLREKEEELLREEQTAAKKKSASPFIWIIVGGVLFVTLVLAFIYRRKWMPIWWLMYFRKEPDDATIERALKVLLRQLKRCGSERREGITLREFAKEVDSTYSINEMSKLTGVYEGYIYGGQNSLQSWQQAKASWRKMMKITMSHPFL